MNDAILYLYNIFDCFGTDSGILIYATRRNAHRHLLFGERKKHYTYPDASVPCKAADWRPENTLIESPRVVIAVLSPSTEARERGVKFKAYQGCLPMQEIVLMSQFAPYVEIWHCDDQDITAWHYLHYCPRENVEINSIDAIYQGLDFEEAEPGEG